MRKYKINGKFVTPEEFDKAFGEDMIGTYEIIEEEEVTLESLSKKIEELERKINDQQIQIADLQLKNWNNIPSTTQPWIEQPYKIYCGAGEPIKTNITYSYGNK